MTGRGIEPRTYRVPGGCSTNWPIQPLLFSVIWPTYCWVITDCYTKWSSSLSMGTWSCSYYRNTCTSINIKNSTNCRNICWIFFDWWNKVINYYTISISSTMSNCNWSFKKYFIFSSRKWSSSFTIHSF